MTGTRTLILDQLDAERSRWMLWRQVVLGLGIAVYFVLPTEPALWLGPALFAATAPFLVFLAPAGSEVVQCRCEVCCHCGAVANASSAFSKASHDLTRVGSLEYCSPSPLMAICV